MSLYWMMLKISWLKCDPVQDSWLNSLIWYSISVSKTTPNVSSSSERITLLHYNPFSSLKTLAFLLVQDFWQSSTKLWSPILMTSLFWMQQSTLTRKRSVWMRMNWCSSLMLATLAKKDLSSPSGLSRSFRMTCTSVTATDFSFGEQPSNSLKIISEHSMTRVAMPPEVSFECQLRMTLPWSPNWGVYGNCYYYRIQQNYALTRLFFPHIRGLRIIRIISNKFKTGYV